MKLWRSLEGCLEAELLTADGPGAMDAIAGAGIVLWDVLPEDALRLRFRVSAGSFRRLKSLTDRRGEKLTVLRRQGIYWRFRALVRRPVLLLGLLFLFCAQLFLPTRVLFIRISGNETVPARQILAAAEDCGLSFGADRRAIRSEKIKNALLGAIPELKWAGVNTSGCVAVISVAEKQPAPAMEPEEAGVASLAASRDGVLKSLLVTRGTALCAAGQAVERGQVLISGYTDCGNVVLAQRAKGEAMAYTAREIQAILPQTSLQRVRLLRTERRVSILFGKKRIKLWFGSGISGMECGRMYREYPLTLPGGFQLPVRLAVDTCSVWETARNTLPEDGVRGHLQTFSRDYLRSAMIAGSILNASETMTRQKNAYVFSGRYSCLESIGVTVREQTGETNEQGS